MLSDTSHKNFGRKKESKIYKLQAPFSVRLFNYLFTYFCGCRSVLCGGSTAIFMFGYCIYFYVRSRMSGLLQLSFFIGYNACICYAFFLIFGAISFRVSMLFVRHIYHNVKREWITHVKHKAILVTPLIGSALWKLKSAQYICAEIVSFIFLFFFQIKTESMAAHFGRGFFLVAHFSLGGRWRDEWNDGKICCWSWLPGEFLRWIRSPSCLRNIFSGHFYQELCYWGISIKYKVSMDKFFHEFL